MQSLAKTGVILLVSLALCTVSEARVRTYQENTTNIANPERGFYVQDVDFLNSSGTAAAKTTRLNNARTNDNITIVRTYFRLDAWRTSDIPQSALDYLTAAFNAVRAANAKIVPKFSYNHPTNDQMDQAIDASLSQIKRHIQQIEPILRANADVIAFMEAGFIGAWGEWHHSSNGLDNDASRREVLYALLAALPSDRMAALRYNFHKRSIYGTNTPLGPDSAFSGSYRARTGAHNDCLGASAEDWGTYYPEDAAAIAWQKNYLNQDNRYLPQGGETCNVSSYSTCSPMLANLAQMRWDVLNIDYETSVLDSWVSGGCMDDVRKRLGYRLRLTRASLPDSVRNNGTLAGELVLVNSGWGKLYNARPAHLVLRRSGSTTDTVSIALPSDPRRWIADDTIRVAFSVSLPAGTRDGVYDLFLNLPDNHAGLRARPQYSVRLANNATWEASTGFNNLGHPLTVYPNSTKIRDASRGMPQSTRRELVRNGMAGGTVQVHNLRGQALWFDHATHGCGVYLVSANRDNATRAVAVTASGR